MYIENNLWEFNGILFVASSKNSSIFHIHFFIISELLTFPLSKYIDQLMRFWYILISQV